MIPLIESAHLVGELFAFGAEVGCGYLLFAATAVRRFPRSGSITPRGGSPIIQTTAGVTILKPLHGDGTGLLDRLLSFCDQHYGGPIQLVLGVQDRSDPAVCVARRVATLRPRCDIEIVVGEAPFGANRKVANLIQCFDHARHDVIVLADSDISVDDGYVGRIVDTLASAKVGAVTCLYCGQAEVLAGRLSALAIDAHFLPNVLVGLACGAATPCFGSTIALRRETLARIGGLSAFADKLADDYAIGAAVRSLGLTVAVPGFAVRHDCDESTLAAFYTHQLRVARTIRSIDPRGHAGSLITHPLPLAIVAVALCGPNALWLVVAVLSARCVLVRAVRRRFGTGGHSFGLLPLCDIALFAVYVASFCGSRVEWRGQRLVSLPDGSLAPEKDPTPA